MAVAPPNIRTCLDPKPPVMDCAQTPIYGAPKGKPGRNSPNGQPPIVSELPVSGIAIHCVKDTYDGYLSKVCQIRTSLGCHASFHYILDADTGRITKIVDENNVAWAFQSYNSNFPITSPVDGCPCPEPCPQPPCPIPSAPTTYPGWPVLSAEFPDVAADFYTINIGITSPSRPEEARLDNQDCCAGQPYGLTPYAYQQLVHLVAWIESRYPAVTVDQQHIQFHDMITETLAGCEECPCGPQNTCFVCDVSHYCEGCANVGDPTFTVSEDILFVYGENSAGCKVRIRIDDLRALILNV